MWEREGCVCEIEGGMCVRGCGCVREREGRVCEKVCVREIEGGMCV